MTARFMTSYRDPSVVMMARIIPSSCYPVVPCRPGLVGPHNHPPAAPGLARSIHYMEAVHGCIVQVLSGCIGQLLQFSPCRLLTRSANLIIKVSKEFTNSTNEMQLNFNSLLSLIISLFTRLPCWKSVPPSPWSMTAMIGSHCPEEAEGGAGVTWLGATRTLGTRPASRGGRGWPPATGRLPHVSSFLYICSNLALRSLCFFSQRQARAGPGDASTPSGSGCT